MAVIYIDAQNVWRQKTDIGMLHVPALPGAPLNKLDLEAIAAWVLDDARALADGGVDALLLENFGDIPFYPQRTPPHTVAVHDSAWCRGEARRPPSAWHQRVTK